jgi:hypothetical protein
VTNIRRRQKSVRTGIYRHLYPWIYIAKLQLYIVNLNAKRALTRHSLCPNVRGPRAASRAAACSAQGSINVLERYFFIISSGTDAQMSNVRAGPDTSEPGEAFPGYNVQGPPEIWCSWLFHSIRVTY